MGISFPDTGPHLGDSDGRSASTSSVSHSRRWLGPIVVGVVFLFVLAWVQLPVHIALLLTLLASLTFIVHQKLHYHGASAIMLVGDGSTAIAMASALDVPPFFPDRLFSLFKRVNSTPHVIHARNRDEATKILPSISCDRIVLMSMGYQTWIPPADMRGHVPGTTSSVDELAHVLGRLPLQFLPFVPDFEKHRSGRLNRSYALLKRGLDLAVAIPVGLVLLPVLPLVALAIRLDSPGPIFYSQVRVGYRDCTFRIYKFRSMRQDAERSGAVWAASEDERVTRVGRVLRATRIDEIPQLWNVLRGDMSLVGPRPERPEFTAILEDEFPGFRLRTGAKPGLTGWAQVCAGYCRTVADSRLKLEYDLYYLMHRSVALDLLILLRTIPVVIGRRGS
jgi:lipopolysaccharide/colanic/teichoic acid biosynthesis glycosyltransferase